MADERHLHAVDPDTGEVLCDNPACMQTRIKLDELTRKYHGALSQIGNLRRDKDAEAKAHEAFPKAHRLFDIWRTVCKHPRSEWTAARFWEIEPRLREYGEVRICRAILGAAYEPYTPTRKNGKPNPQNKWHQIMHPDKIEDFEQRAPGRFTDVYIEEKLNASE